MRASLATRCAICCACLAVTGAEAAWYVSSGIGIALHSGMDQMGWNEDTVCYPTDACFADNPASSVPGYRWRYAIAADAGTGLAIALGREFGRLRIEVSAARSRNNVEQAFVDIEYLDGSARVSRDGPVVADVTTSIGDLATLFASLNVYRDFAASGARMVPYLGVGLGAAFTKIRDVHFSADYRDTSRMPPAYDPPLSFYGSNQDGDHADTVLVGHVHAGIDYMLRERMLIGAKLTCSLVEGTADDGIYSRHPMHEKDPGFANRSTFDATRTCSVAVTLRRQLGR